MCRFSFVKDWFNDMQTAKNGKRYAGFTLNGNYTTSLCHNFLPRGRHDLLIENFVEKIISIKSNNFKTNDFISAIFFYFSTILGL